jgi:hypothetical protein
MPASPGNGKETPAEGGKSPAEGVKASPKRKVALLSLFHIECIIIILFPLLKTSNRGNKNVSFLV